VVERDTVSHEILGATPLADLSRDGPA
jgi:hypothetical protein